MNYKFRVKLAILIKTECNSVFLAMSFRRKRKWQQVK